MTFPLEGIRVLDLTVWQQGPYASTMLADMGADVIKIEAPLAPDPGRAFLFSRRLGLSSYFEAHNRNKRSLAIDLKHPKGKAAFWRLAERADVFIHNTRGGSIERLGLDYESFRKVNPRIIYVWGSGYGPRGPDTGFRSFDILGQARGGIMTVIGEPDDPPLPVGPPIADQTAAFLAAYGIMLALFHRERTGEGQQVNTSLLGGQVALQSFNITNYLLHGRLPGRRPRGGFTALWNIYRGGDGRYFVVGMLEERWWPEFCRAIGQPELEHDPMYATAIKRHENFEALLAHLDAHFATQPAREWVRRITEHDLIAAPVQDYEELAADPQVPANDYIVEVERPGHGPIRVVGVPVELSRTPGSVRSMAPALGRHTVEVLREYGFSAEEIAALRDEGVIGVPADEAGSAK